MDSSAISEAISSAIAEAQVEVVDISGNGRSFEAVVASPMFSGKSRIAQHKMVYDALGEMMDDAIHALRVRTIVISKQGR